MRSFYFLQICITHLRSIASGHQSRAILFGAVLAFVPLSAWLGYGFIRPSNFSPYLFLPLAIFPLVIGYTILRFRFLRTDDFVRRGFMYVTLSLMVMIGYALLVTGAGLFFNPNLPANNAFLVGGYIFLIAILLEPLRTRFQNTVDTIFFRGERAFAEQLEDFSHRLTTALDLQHNRHDPGEQIASTLTRAGFTSIRTIHSTTFSPPCPAPTDVPPATSALQPRVRWRVTLKRNACHCIWTTPPYCPHPCNRNSLAWHCLERGSSLYCPARNVPMAGWHWGRAYPAMPIPRVT